MLKCHCCSVEKDPSILEIYPFPDDGIVDDEPIPPFFDLDVQPEGDIKGGGTWKRATVCHSCFHKLEPDMWISEKIWMSMNPSTPFIDLPFLFPCPE